ncbi:hypothetical protein M199_gp185 [Halogranum tailed virus 1]|uniref:Uncharacterized protein n=1 Tax=Halogranum tailed virus 1 TaxID=1273749 RepID=R4TGU1_9CAUD|nr:hypothetical protein M199_gp185 [Halogranum tailed virus 1]AGM11481.1 hypothetical protein HGTV1_184 [Halogranum tailed virus 1]
MTDANLVQTKLHNQVQAGYSKKSVEDSRYLYHMFFYEDIGWDWLYTQVRKVSSKLDVDLETWKIEPLLDDGFVVVIREVDRRANIDDKQGDLFDYQ